MPTTSGELPVTRHPRVTHVGTLDPALKGLGPAGPESQEGHGLSVSDCPREWERIARLGGYPWHVLTHPTGALLDAYALDDDQRAVVTAWALEEGLVTQESAWRVTCWYDSELSSLHPTYDEALAEVDEDEDSEDGPLLVEVAGLQSTTLLHELLGQRSGLDPHDHLLVLWVEAHTDLCGVWWQDEHGPWSAPPRRHPARPSGRVVRRAD